MSTFGLHRVWPPEGSQATAENVVDIIAIHGLDTCSPRTWEAYATPKDKTSRRVHWLKDEDMLSKTIPNIRVYTYDWNANTHSQASVDNLRGHANTLLDRISQERKETRTVGSNPVIFCASCFGGLLLVKALTTASRPNSQYAEILRSTVGIIFLGTPFRGSEAASAAKVRVQVAKWAGSETNKTLLNNLSADSEALDETVQDFMHLLRHTEKEVLVRIYHETRRTEMASAIPVVGKIPLVPRLLEKIIVPERSARLDGYTSIGLDVNHAMLNKYRGRDDQSFKTVAFALKELVEVAYDIFKRKGGPLNVTDLRNLHSKFVGRTEELGALGNFLMNANWSTKQTRVVVSGIGGIGKSELALSLATRLRESQISAAADFKKIESILDCSNARQALSNNRERWLLILDNADDLEIDYSKFLPTGGTIIITTRNHKLGKRYCGDSSEHHHLDLEELSETAAVDLFFSMSGLDRTPDSELLARKLVLESLHRHTLAIIQAGAYIESGEATLAEYLTLFISRKKEEVHVEKRTEALKYFDVQEQSRYRSAFETFEISMTVLKKAENECALKLLNVLSVLHQSPMSTEFFFEAWIAGRSILGEQHSISDDALNSACSLTPGHRSLILSFFGLEAQVWTKTLFQIAVEKLSSLSLVKCTGRSLSAAAAFEDLSMHPLVHLWACIRQPPSVRLDSWMISGSLMAFAHAVAGPNRYNYKSFQTHISVHIEALLQRAPDTAWTLEHEQQTTPILTGCAIGLWNAGNNKLLDWLLGEIFKSYDTAAITAPLKLADLVCLAAGLEFAKGRSDHAIEIETSLKDRLSLTGPKSCQFMVDVCMKLARTYSVRRKSNEAVAVLKQSLKAAELLKSMHPLLQFQVQIEIANVYTEHARHLDAVEILRPLLSILTPALTDGHMVTTRAQELLAHAYCSLDKTDLAIELYSKAIRSRVTLFSPRSFDAQELKVDLANAYFRINRTDEARDVLEELLKSVKEAMVEVDQSRLRLEYEASEAYLNHNCVTEAIAVLKHVVAVQSRSLAPSHASRLAALHKLGSAYVKNNEWLDGIATYETMLREVLLTNDVEHHSGTLRARRDLASAYFHIGRRDEGIEMLQKSLSLLEQVQPLDSPERLDTLQLLGEMALNHQQPQVAIDCFIEVVRAKNSKLPEHDLDRLAYEHYLGVAYLNAGQPEDALPILEKVAEVTQKFHSFQRSRLANNWELAKTYEVLGKEHRAKDLFLNVIRDVRSTWPQGEIQRKLWEERFLSLPVDVLLSALTPDYEQGSEVV